MTTAKELSFEDFKRACKLPGGRVMPEWRVRAALKALGLSARMEGRATRYDVAWIDRVLEWDKAHMGV